MAQQYEVGYRKPPKTTRFKAGKSGNPKGRPKGQQQSGNRSFGGTERADHRERGRPGAPRHQAARLDQVADGASPPRRCAGNHRTARPLCARDVGANRSRDLPGRRRRTPDSTPLRTPSRQHARQERNEEMKIDRDLANAIYRTDFGAFTYRAFEAINPGQRLFPTCPLGATSARSSRARPAKISRGCRALLETPFYKGVFPATRLNPKKAAEGEFEITKHGSRLATSVGGMLTGRSE